MFTDTVASVIVLVEFAEWCLHCGSILVDIFRIFLQVLFLLALFAFYCVSVMELNESDNRISNAIGRTLPVGS